MVDNNLFIEASNDYNPKLQAAYTFFKMLQSKLYYIISGYTVAGLIYKIADLEKESIGLTILKSSPDGLIYRYNVVVAKNYLIEGKLNNLTNMFLIF